ncbi:MAG: hypothetical protein ACYTXL_11320 [Nostoc sp.]
MVFLEKRTVEYADNSDNSRKLSQFMNQCLHNRTYYNISFWDLDYYLRSRTNASRRLDRGAMARRI